MKQAARVLLALLVLVALPALAADPPAGVPAQDRMLSLEELVRDALQSSLSLRVAVTSTRSVETGVLAARGAFDPQLTATPSYSRGTTDFLYPDPSSTLSGIQTGKTASVGIGGTLPSSTSYSATLDHSWQNQSNAEMAQALVAGPQPSVATTLNLSLRQPLLKGFGPTIATAPLRIASLLAQSAEERLNRSVEQTIADVETAYWSLGSAEAIERLSKDSFDRAEDLLNRNIKMRELALISEVDLITSRRGMQSRLTSLTEARRRRQDAMERLVFLVYAEHAVEKLPALSALRTQPPLDSVPGLPAPNQLDAKALEQRSDVKAARLDVQQGALSLRVARNALLPDLAMTGSYAAQTLGTDAFRISGNSRVGDQALSTWKVGLTLSYPLSNRAARAAYQRSIWDSQGQALTLALAENGVRADVRSASRAVTVNAERLQQAQLGLDLARQQYEGGQKQLQLGLIDSFRLLQMEDDVTNAEMTTVQVRYDLALALTGYELATGSLRKKWARLEEEARAR